MMKEVVPKPSNTQTRLERKDYSPIPSITLFLGVLFLVGVGKEQREEEKKVYANCSKSRTGRKAQI
jgi:hypothetical protein